jgi:ABC transporter with metal-binding/Fe-S-binding domain ATP-binding protein
MKEGHEIKYLITMISEKSDSWMFHHPCIDLTKLQAKALGIKQVLQRTTGEKEKELDDLKKVLMKVKNEIDGIVSGAVASNYQKSRVDRICEELGLKSIAPLWQKDPEELIEEESSIFDIIITGVASEGFNESWLGRKIDKKCIEDLKELNKKYGVHIIAEGGEFETFVIDSPIFKKKIKLLDFNSAWDKKTNSGCLEVKKAELIQK